MEQWPGGRPNAQMAWSDRTKQSSSRVSCCLGRYPDGTPWIEVRIWLSEVIEASKDEPLIVQIVLACLDQQNRKAVVEVREATSRDTP